MWRLGLVSVLLTPTWLHAAVTINEVAWMGSSESANDEWIELYNSGDAVVVDGWTLSDGMNLNITLAGTIPAQQYAVLERTDDSSAPGSAFLIYTGALANTGATLTLRRADNSIADQVSGGENWANIGGDNATKETAQYTTSGWVTGTPTPGSANVITSSVRQENEAEVIQKSESGDQAKQSSKKQSSTDSSETIRLELPGVTLQLVVDAQTVAYVNQPIEFSVEPSGIGKTLADSLQYGWNFGDAETARGQTVTHAYQFPGTYVVTVFGEYARQHQVARHEITVLPVNFSITTNQDGDVQIHNDAKYEADLSGYVVMGERAVHIPERTIMLPGATITIPRERLGATVGSVIALYDHAAQIAATNQPIQSSVSDVVYVAAASVEASPSTQLLSAQNVDVEMPTERFAFIGDASATDVEVQQVPELRATSTVLAGSLAAAASDSEPPIQSSQLPYLALAGLLILGFLAIAASAARPQNSAP